MHHTLLRSFSSVAGARGADVVVVGGGVIGINVASELKRRQPDRHVVVVEKETECGLHASGRNSGVLHAGFYYTGDSLKARFTRDGCAAMKDFILSKGLDLHQCGKLVVVKDESEYAGLDLLLERGKVNGVEVHEITEKEAVEIEPLVKTHRRALWSPSTASASPVEVMKAFVEEARVLGVEIRANTRYVSSARDGSGWIVRTSGGDYPAGYVVNCAGLYADKVAHEFGFGTDFTILPFKGLYMYMDSAHVALKTNIYPVPNMANPFLGVHYTVTYDGKTKIGPTAIPAFWREQYGLLDNFDLAELKDVLTTEAGLFFNAGFDFRGLALEEMKKYYQPNMVREATSMIHGVTAADFKHWARPGIRAQLVNTRTRKLEMDFCLEGDDKSFHVLNAVSPAWTCSIPFSKHVVDKIDALLAN